MFIRNANGVVHRMNADSTPVGCQPSDQTNRPAGC